MPMINVQPKEWEDLVERLRQEITGERKDGPRIYVEPVRGTAKRRVTVVWEKWVDVPIEDRGRVIVEAFERAQGAETALAISLALGLTPEDAKKMGIALPAA
jgi:hypothetical protein